MKAIGMIKSIDINELEKCILNREKLKEKLKKEEELIKAFTSLRNNWQVALTEWKLEHNVHEITEYQAKRFAKWYINN